MFAFLPIITLILLSIILTNYYSWRRAMLASAIIWGVLIVITTEFLSYLRWLSFLPLVVFWSAISLIFLIAVILFFRQKRNQILEKLGQAIKISKKQWFCSILLLIVLSIITIIGIIAIVAPPNTWDSMTYHMSRVVHWVQNESVAFYPTYNLPQLFHPPLAEYIITHLQILSGTDRYANLVQWLSLIGSVVAVSSIAQELNTNHKGQIFAAVFAVTIPMGILQASSTQNDYAVSFWILCLAYYVLISIKYKLEITTYIFIGASLGLAILTKSSGYLYAFGFMVWYSLFQLNKWGLQAWKFILIPSLIALDLNLNHYLRNYNLFKSFISAPDNFAAAYKMEVFSLPTFISNLLRNLTLHTDIIRNLQLENFITPTTGIVHKALLIIHNYLGIDLYDPRTTAGSYKGVPGLSFDENIAGNPLHLAIIFLAIILLFLNKNTKNNRLLWHYIAVSWLGFLLVCLLLKLQIYQSRHHLALFLLLSPTVGLALSKLPFKRLANCLVILVIVVSLPWVFQNKFRPIMAEQNIFNTPRITQYFTNRAELEQSYRETAQVISNLECNYIGLSIGRGISVGNEYWEYPLWPLLTVNNSKIKLQHIEPENVSNVLAKQEPYANFNPCAIIAIRQKPESPISVINFKNQIYKENWSQSSMSVLVP